MNNREHFEQLYQINYANGSKFMQQKNYAAAKRSFQIALSAEVELIKMTTGDVQSKHKQRADKLVEWINQLAAYVTPPQVSRSSGDDKGGSDEKEEHKVTAKIEESRHLSADEALQKLNELIGLSEVKKSVADLVELIKNRQERINYGLAVPPQSYHMVFYGNPGTGKTTVARLMADIFYSLGIVSKGQFVEAKREDLVAGYVGQTDKKTAEVIKSAIGGVLFIDEAYTLNAGGNDFGKQAIDTLLTYMEDYRDDLIVIGAGYTKQMDSFLKSNPGLMSRFSQKIFFTDYDGEALFKIFLSMCKKNDYILDPSAEIPLKNGLDIMYNTRDENFGNARDVRLLFELTTRKQAIRLNKMPHNDSRALMTILPEDLAFEEMRSTKMH